MSRAVAAVHGQFGRAVIYNLNRPFNIHAHREGHLIFHLSGDDGGVLVSGAPCRATNESVVAVSPWEPHNFVPGDLDEGSTFFVLYVNPDWFASGVSETRLRFGRSEFARTPALDAQIRCVSALVYAGQRVTPLDCELRSLIQACYEEILASNGSGRGPLSIGSGHRFSRAQVDAVDGGVARRRHRARRGGARRGLVASAFLQAVSDADRAHAKPLCQHPAHGAGDR